MRSRRIREHLEDIVFRTRIVVAGFEDFLFVPDALPVRLGFAGIVAVRTHVRAKALQVHGAAAMSLISGLGSTQQSTTIRPWAAPGRAARTRPIMEGEMSTAETDLRSPRSGSGPHSPRGSSRCGPKSRRHQAGLRHQDHFGCPYRARPGGRMPGVWREPRPGGGREMARTPRGLSGPDPPADRTPSNQQGSRCGAPVRRDRDGGSAETSC